jgi:hypothetical protein
MVRATEGSKRSSKPFGFVSRPPTQILDSFIRSFADIIWVHLPACHYVSVNNGVFMKVNTFLCLISLRHSFIGHESFINWCLPFGISYKILIIIFFNMFGLWRETKFIGSLRCLIYNSLRVFQFLGHRSSVNFIKNEYVSLTIENFLPSLFNTLQVFLLPYLLSLLVAWYFKFS